MVVDLADFTGSLQREVTPLGTTPPDEDTLLPYLTDAFWAARLNGFMAGYTVDEDGVITPINATDPDLDQKYVALIVLYAGIRILRNRILNMNTQFRAKAGPVEFEQQNSANLLTEMLKQLKATQDRVIEELDQFNDPTAVLALDAYSVRLFSHNSYYGGLELT